MGMTFLIYMSSIDKCKVRLFIYNIRYCFTEYILIISTIFNNINNNFVTSQKN